jgi:hypothetical protein
LTPVAKTKPRHTRCGLLAKHDDGVVIEHARHNDQKCDGPNVNYAMYQAGRGSFIHEKTTIQTQQQKGKR